MLEIKAKIKARRGAYKVQTKGTLRLPFAQRRTAGVRAKLVSGEEVAVRLPHGEMLRGGDLVVASDGRIIEIQAETERVLSIVCESPAALARCAYELGSRHVAVETGDGWLRVAADHDLEHVLEGLGAKLTVMEAPFEPETGAGSVGDSHDAGGHAHSHDHEHSHACGHDHGPEHAHDHDHEHDHDHAHCDHPHHGHEK